MNELTGRRPPSPGGVVACSCREDPAKQSGRTVMKTQYVGALSLMTGVAIGAVAIDRLHAQAKPPGYIITEVEIIDQAKFNEFAPKASASLAKFGGKYLIRGGRTAALEGGEPP